MLFFLNLYARMRKTLFVLPPRSTVSSVDAGLTALLRARQICSLLLNLILPLRRGDFPDPAISPSQRASGVFRAYLRSQK